MRLRLTPFVFALAIAIAFTAAAAAQPVPHKERCDGTLTSITATTMTFTGVGKATHMGVYTIDGAHDYFDDGTLVGVFINTASDDSTISGTYTGTYAPVPGTTLIQFNVEVHYLTGTGRLTGVTGLADVVALLDLSTGQFHYDTLGTWDLD